ncbi:hypothetical protein A176_007753 [Myxococcus hansupus]|uniref:DUF6311 domain-containing protein n=1 Tax=Pseudomyxococcus hansupus TaxID=1297742 RepID=A0A0H4X522_9BACT|nr:hypothetical protein [Myxococcus hansupus]AKQ70841.1 hypothetical protein A176_007753 [Myxococcus hansupus]
MENGFPEHTYVRFGDLAYRRGLTTNSGYSARLNEPRVAEVCAALMDDVEHGRLAEDTVYVVDAAKRPSSSGWATASPAAPWTATPCAWRHGTARSASP